MTEMEQHNRPPVDIIVPVYRNLAVTQRCIRSVLKNTDLSQHRLIIVDDASPEPEVSAWCDEIARESGVILLRHEQNQGFVVSANDGMSQSETNDVVLLNSDTEVPPDWLPRLQACAWSAEDVATVTPMSNNASICSYPYFFESTELPEDMDLETLDGFFAEANRGESVEIPTAVGFCMYIRRDCLEQFGLFDAERYGRGYGEECDFSLRMRIKERRNMLCLDLFVYHQGNVSFGQESEERVGAASQLVLERYPYYTKLVSDFIVRDPVRPYREQIDLRRSALPGQAEVLLKEGHTRAVQMQHRLAQVQEQMEIYFARCEDYEAKVSASELERINQIQDYEAQVQKYIQLLDESRAAWKSTDAALGETEQKYIQLLDESRAAWKSTDDALGQAQQELAQTQLALDDARSLYLKPCIRWIKRKLNR